MRASYTTGAGPGNHISRWGAAAERTNGPQRLWRANEGQIGAGLQERRGKLAARAGGGIAAGLLRRSGRSNQHTPVEPRKKATQGKSP